MIMNQSIINRNFKVQNKNNFNNKFKYKLENGNGNPTPPLLNQVLPSYSMMELRLIGL